MTIAEMLQQSAVLTILGMLIVFAFLWLMIICIDLVGALIHALGLDEDVRPKDETPKSAGPEITAAITGAIREYQKEGHHE
jgi:oxaloacetate decarboxylase gamma subunit